MGSTTITGIIIIAVIILPIWYLIRTQSAGKRKLHKLLEESGKGSEFEATEHESWSGKIIGIDRDHGKVAYANLKDASNHIHLVDLALYNRCFSDKTQKNNGSKNGESALSGISLHFVAREKGTPDYIIPLYSDEIDNELTNEIQLAEEWADKINSSLKKK